MSSLYFLRAQYRGGRVEALDQISYMNQRNEEAAEKVGGSDKLEGPAKTRYFGIRQRLIVLAAADEVAANYIAALEAEIGEAYSRATKAEAELRAARGETLDRMPAFSNIAHALTLIRGYQSPCNPLNAVEAYRNYTLIRAKTTQPNLYI